MYECLQINRYVMSIVAVLVTYTYEWETIQMFKIETKSTHITNP